MRPARLLRDERGASAVEFAMVVPMFLAAMIFMMEGALYSWTKTGLRHGAVEAARCAVVDVTQCSSTSATQTYASQHAFGLRPDPSAFTVSDQSCGTQVTVTFTYQAYFGMITLFNGTIQQSACYLG